MSCKDRRPFKLIETKSHSFDDLWVGFPFSSPTLRRSEWHHFYVRWLVDCSAANQCALKWRHRLILNCIWFWSPRLALRASFFSISDCFTGECGDDHHHHHQHQHHVDDGEHQAISGCCDRKCECGERFSSIEEQIREKEAKQAKVAEKRAKQAKKRRSGFKYKASQFWFPVDHVEQSGK